MWVKYKIEKKQIYQNGGWVDTDPLQTRLGDAIGEYDSFSGCSGYDILYRWQPANPNEDWVCSGYTKYYKEYYQVSYDNGSTWTNVVPEQTRTGDLVQNYSYDCGYVYDSGKWRATYASGTSSAACDSSSAITQNEISVDGLLSVEIGNCVREIGYAALEDSVSHYSTFSSVTLSDSVTTIGDYAFVECWNLGSVTFPNSVTTIGDFAFYHCGGMTNIAIPESVTNIGEQPFNNHSGSIINITVDPNNPNYDSRNNCNALIETITNRLIVGCDNTVIPNTVTCIGTDAFGNSSFTSITIPNNVTEISKLAFFSCKNLTGITIPDSVITIGPAAFLSCNGITSVTIGNSVTSIGGQAFQGCSSLTSITIPNSVTSIGDAAFAGCSSLTSVTIGNSVTSIGNQVFDNCSGLTSITIPSSVTSFGHTSFKRCNNLTSVVVESGNSVYDSRNNCNAIIQTSNNALVAGCKTTIIPSNVVSIGIGAFASCSSLTSISIPNSVISIDAWAFMGCTGLSRLTIPNSVTRIHNHAFNGCSGLTSITIGSGVTIINVNAFSDCTSLQSITINATTPPALDNTTVFENTNDCLIRVPATSLTLYQNATVWSQYASRIVAIT